MVQALRAAGYTIIPASDTSSTLQAIAEFEIDLSIVDAVLVELLKTLARQYGKNRVLVVTATPSAAEAILAYRYGAVDYISKAFDASSLLDAVTAALQKRPVHQSQT
jgi:DNA-binding response OmpR family regulator